MQIVNSKIEELKGMLQTPQNIVILSHTNPDGDAIGSSLAWAEMLQNMGHKVTPVVPNKYPYYLDFMPNTSSMLFYKDDTEGRDKAEGNLHGVGLQPEGHQVVTHAEA